MATYLQTISQFGGLILVVIIVAALNLHFRFHRSLVASTHAAASTTSPTAATADKVIEAAAAESELRAWRFRQWMAPRRRSLLLGIVLAALVFSGLVSLLIELRAPRLVHANSALAKAKDDARAACQVFINKDDTYGAMKALLKDSAVLKIRSDGEAARAKRQAEFPSAALTTANSAETLIRQLGPMVVSIPLVLILLLRSITKPGPSADGRNTDTAWWLMTEELCSLLTTVITIISAASFLFFHLYIDGQRVQQCVHTSGHWYTWSASLSTFCIAVGILAVMTFLPTDKRKLEGFSTNESASIVEGLALTAASVSRSLFYVMSTCFAFYTAITLPALKDSQAIYHDTTDAVAGLAASRVQIIIALIVAPVGVYIYAGLRDAHVDSAISALTSALTLTLRHADAQSFASSSASGSVPALSPISTSAASSSAPQLLAKKSASFTPVTADEDDDVSAAPAPAPAAPPAAPPMDVPAAPSIDAAPAPPPPPPGPPPASAPRSGGISAADLAGKKLSKASTSAGAPGGAKALSLADANGRPTPEALLAEIAKRRNKLQAPAAGNTSASSASSSASPAATAAASLQPSAKREDTSAVPLDGGMPKEFASNMIAALQYQGVKRRLAVEFGSGGVELKKLIHARATTVAALKQLCAEHKYSYQFPDLALLQLAVHFGEGGTKAKDSTLKCGCGKEEMDDEDDEFRD